MRVVAGISNCTTNYRVATAHCCTQPGAIFDSPNRCLRTSADVFSACVSQWSSEEWYKLVHGGHSNISTRGLLADGNAGVSPNTTRGNRTANRNGTSGHGNATARCWDMQKKKGAAGRVKQGVAWGAIAFTVMTVASYTTFW